METPYKRKVTLSLDGSVLRRMQDAVEEGVARSQSSLVSEAVTEYLARRKQEWLRDEYAAAARDPRFIADNDDVEHVWAVADAESAALIPPYEWEDDDPANP